MIPNPRKNLARIGRERAGCVIGLQAKTQLVSPQAADHPVVVVFIGAGRFGDETRIMGVKIIRLKPKSKRKGTARHIYIAKDVNFYSQLNTHISPGV